VFDPAPTVTRQRVPARTRAASGPPRRGARLPLLLLLATFAGCASKPKPAVEPVRLAADAPAVTIRPSKDGLGVWTFVSEVDGVPVPFKKRFLDDGTSAPVRVAAGFHEVEVTINAGRVVYRWTFGHDFLLGHTYRVGLAGPFSSHVRLHDLTAGTSKVIEGPTRL
jgi:hypothetical protein